MDLACYALFETLYVKIDRLSMPVVMVQVRSYARLSDSIIGWGSSLGRWARVDNKSVIGEDVHVKVGALPGHANARHILRLHMRQSGVSL